MCVSSRDTFSRVTRLSCPNGFTLVEVVMAMVILGIGIISIVGLQIKNMSMNTTSRIHSDSHTLAMDQMEFLLSVPFAHDALEPQGDPAVENDGKTLIRGPYRVEWDVVDNDTVISHSRKVHLLVSWNNKPIAWGDFTRIATML